VNNRFMINYTPGSTPLHRLNGTTKVLGFFVMTVYIIMTFDVRVLGCAFILCAAGIVSMKPNWKPILFVAGFMTVMAGVIGSLFIVLVRPQSGLEHVGGQTLIFRMGSALYLTKELLWYLGAMFFKRLCSLAAALTFILSITPSELAAGLNAVGLPYKACTIISLAFRTIPDIARDFTDIKNSLSMRGLELDPRRANLVRRLKQAALILIPLITTSFGRVEMIANAMDLRGYGKLRKRSWYRGNPPARADWTARACIACIALFCVYYIAVHRIIAPPVFDYWCPWITAAAQPAD
jgi:energy-coupling factor transport system permease protein